MFATFVFSDDYVQEKVILIFLCLLAAFVSIAVRPYKYWIHNIVDGTIFLILAIVYVFHVYEAYLNTGKEDVPLPLRVVGDLFLITPGLYMITYLVCKLAYNCFFRKSKHQEEEEEEEMEEQEEGLLNGDEGRLQIQATEPCPLERVEFHRSYHRHHSNASNIKYPYLPGSVA